MQARRPGGADLFICYGGVVARPAVVAGADWFVTSFKDLIETLD
jgi:phosphoserine phosphatase